MAAEPSHLWRHNFIFLSWIVVQMMLKKFQIFHMQRSTWRIFTFTASLHFTDTASLMTSWKISSLPHWEFITMYKAKDFSIAPFQRYRGPKFIVFFKMVPVTRDLWRHNYKPSMLSKKIHTMVKILCRSDLPFLRKWFLKRKNLQIANGKRMNKK